jgi:glycosyltransferase involved in cell wall biosynthesis
VRLTMRALFSRRTRNDAGRDWRAAYARIFERNLFDHDWYAENYPCIWETGLSPLEHFVKYGAELGRKPSAAVTTADEEMIGRILTTPQSVDPLPHDPEEPLVSIICITYNQARYIEQTLDSILAQQTSFKFEILVGDDCSSDATPEIIARYAENHSEIVAVLRKTNVGPNANFVDLARRVRGRYVAICEGDDFWTDPAKLQKQVKFFEDHPEFTVCFHRVRVLYEDCPHVEEYFPESSAGEVSLHQLVRQNCIQTNSVMYRWRFNTTHPFELKPEIVPGDWYTHLLQAKVGRVGYLDDCMAVYRRHAMGMWSPYANELARARRYGNGEIEFFRSLKNHFGGPIWSHLDETQKVLFRRVALAFLDDCDVEALHRLIDTNDDVAAECLADLGFDQGTATQTDSTALRESLLRQSRISVIVTTYNHKEYIGRCLDSILAQEGLIDLQIIIGDDCSTDGTAEIVKSYAEDHPGKIALIARETNVGMLQNMKDCLAIADGRYIAFCEGDDYWLSPRKLMKQLATVRPDPQVKMCFNWLLLELAATGSFVPHAEQSELPNGEISFFGLARRPLTANFSCCFYRAEAIAAVPDSYFTGTSSADRLFNLYVADVGKVIFIKELLSVYRIQSRGQWSGLPTSVQRAQTLAFKREFAQIFGEGRGFEDIAIRVTSISIAKSLHPRIRGAVLDWPAEGNVLELADGTIAFQGWVVDPDGDTAVVVSTGSYERRLPLDMLRPDVIEALYGGTGGEAPAPMCGFSFLLPYRNDRKIRLDLEIDGRPTPWIEIEIQQQPS